jgi:hypothetical protein
VPDELDAARQACDAMPAKVRPFEREIQEADLALVSLCEDVASHSSNDATYVPVDVSPARERVEEAKRRLARFSSSSRTLAYEVASAMDRRSVLEAEARRREEEEARRVDWVERAVAVAGLVKSSEEELERLEAQVEAQVQSQRTATAALTPVDSSNTTPDLLLPPSGGVPSATNIEAFSAAQIDPIQAHLDELSADMDSLSPGVDGVDDAAVISPRVEAVTRLRARVAALVEVFESLQTTKVDDVQRAQEPQFEGDRDDQEADGAQPQAKEEGNTGECSDPGAGEATGTKPAVQLTVTVSSDRVAGIAEDDDDDDASSPAATDSTGHSSVPPVEDLNSVAIADVRAGLDDVLRDLSPKDVAPLDFAPQQPTFEQVDEAERKLHEIRLKLDNITEEQEVVGELRAELQSKSDVVSHRRRVAEFSSAAKTLDELMSNLLESIDRAEGISDKAYFRNSLGPGTTVRSGSASPLSDTSVPPSSPDRAELSKALASVTLQLERVETVAAPLERHAWITTQVGRMRKACAEMAEMARDRLERQPPSHLRNSGGSRSEASSGRPRTLSNASNSSISPLASRRPPPRASLPKRVPSYGLDRRQSFVPRSASTGSARSVRSVGSSSSLSQLALPSNPLHSSLSPSSSTPSVSGLGDSVGPSRAGNGQSPRVLRRMSSTQSLMSRQGANRYRSDKRAVDRVVGRVVNELNVRVQHTRFPRGRN